MPGRPGRPAPGEPEHAPPASHVDVDASLAAAFHILRGAVRVGETVMITHHLERMGIDEPAIRALAAAGALRIENADQRPPFTVRLHVNAVRTVRTAAAAEPQPAAPPADGTPGEPVVLDDAGAGLAASAVAGAEPAPDAPGDEPPAASVEQMRALLAAIERVESAAEDAASAAARARRDEAWASLAALRPGADGFDAALKRFESADARFAAVRADIRRKAFTWIRIDARHAAVAPYLRLLSDRV